MVSVNVILGAEPETVTVPLFAVILPLAIIFPVTEIPELLVDNFSDPALNNFVAPVPAELISKGLPEVASLTAILAFTVPSNLKSIKLT